MVLWQTTAINSACSIATVQSSICSREKTVKQQFSSLWQRYVTYLPKPSQCVSPQQMLTEDSAASTSTAPPSRSNSTKPSVPDINATRDMINDLYSADEVVHSFYHCTETTCNYQKEKGKKKFDHVWIFRHDLTYDATIFFSLKRRVCTVYSADFTRQRASTIRVHHMEWNPLYVSRPQPI